jgi:hypothetical protein
MEALFSQEKEIEHEFFITDLKNVESGGNFSVFQASGSLRKIIDLRNIEILFFFIIGFLA